MSNPDRPLRVLDVMTRAPIIHREDRAEPLLTLLEGQDFTAVPVADTEGDLLGMVTKLSLRAPGAPHWQLAPRSMGWEDLSDADLRRVLKDSRKNKGRSVQALVEHMTTERSCSGRGSPEARTPPSIGQREFHELVRRWAQTGAACPG